MWLLNASSLKLEYFAFDDGEAPPYGILSHTWAHPSTELTFEDLHSRGHAAFSKKKESYQKLIGCCSVAQKHGLQWVWLDNCCIDKSDHAQLSYAVSSIFQWYQRAEICITYLSDVHAMKDFHRARWFTRGWTLQELLAPTRLVFFNRHWEPLGTRQALASLISHITTIHPEYLMRSWSPSTNSLRLLYDAVLTRQTTKPEDQAYCLLGLLGIYMEVDYGEGLNSAFERLYATVEQYSGRIPSTADGHEYSGLSFTTAQYGDFVRYKNDHAAEEYEDEDDEEVEGGRRR
ncbi:hypothetical protein BT63DRAFT_425417 [Microthyrium microscopicum]|uniref:Heterokaryon incompatibility domain-containing protein n=1 Tax=Microthyrium microscopicum TaxID=703497 RepID=A0A6A6UE92_9PEZI|nr:hypothetical protein BT63DRAFT_425417 [Microthyrium microscopicum]